jgi:DNA-binding response OmpR family regulator
MSTPQTRAGAPAEKKRILLVEDEPHMMEMLKFRLVENQYEVATAADGYTALTQVRSFKPNLVILDLMLPKIDGYTICRLLKFSEEYRMIPVMILSARSTDEDVRRGMGMGADAYMTKPYDPPVLLEKIKELLAKDMSAPPPENQESAESPPG